MTPEELEAVKAKRAMHNEYLQNHPEAFTRWFKPNPDALHTLRPEALPYAGKIVLVTGWHELYHTEVTRKYFPNDTRVGFVLDFCLDIPESELHI